MTHPRVSVLLPVFNGERYVGEALESVLAQSFQDFEVVVIDDGSTDGTPDILRRYAGEDPRVRVFRQPNRGLIAALNRGLALCRAPFVARMDADDIALPRRLELQVEVLESEPALAAVGGQAVYVDDQGRVIGQEPGIPVGEAEVEQAALVACPMLHPTVTFRKEAVEAVGGYPEDAVHAEDYALWARLLEAGYRLRNLAEVLVKVRRGHGGNVSAHHALAQRRSARRVRHRFVHGMAARGRWPEGRVRALARAFPAGGALDRPMRGETVEAPLRDPLGALLPERSVERAVRRWLVGGGREAAAGAAAALRAEGAGFLAGLVRWREDPAAGIALGTPPPPPAPEEPGTAPAVVVPVVGAGRGVEDELAERLGSIGRSSLPPAEVLLVPVGEEAAEVAGRVHGRGGTFEVRVTGAARDIDEAVRIADEAARASSVAYLMPGYRFDERFLERGIAALRAGWAMAVAPVRRLFHGIRLGGEPWLEVAERRPATREQLLGMEGQRPWPVHVCLSGVVRQRAGDWARRLPCRDVESGYLTALEWLYRVPCRILDVDNVEVCEEAYPFRDRLMLSLLHATVRPYLEGFMGRLPAGAVEGTPGRAAALASELDELVGRGYALHWRNEPLLRDFFVSHVRRPWRYPTFRRLVRWGAGRKMAEAYRRAGVRGAGRAALAWLHGRMGTRVREQFVEVG